VQKSFFLEGKGWWREGVEMTQTLYAHMNKQKKRLTKPFLRKITYFLLWQLRILFSSP
jgi:hypothetical protein